MKRIRSLLTTCLIFTSYSCASSGGKTAGKPEPLRKSTNGESLKAECSPHGSKAPFVTADGFTISPESRKNICLKDMPTKISEIKDEVSRLATLVRPWRNTTESNKSFLKAELKTWLETCQAQKSPDVCRGPYYEAMGAILPSSAYEEWQSLVANRQDCELIYDGYRLSKHLPNTYLSMSVNLFMSCVRRMGFRGATPEELSSGETPETARAKVRSMAAELALRSMKRIEIEPLFRQIDAESPFPEMNSFLKQKEVEVEKTASEKTKTSKKKPAPKKRTRRL